MTALLVGAALTGVGYAQTRTPDQASTAPSGRVATPVFGQLPFMQQPRLSPNGKRVAFRLAHAGTTYLAWLDVSAPNAKPVLIAAAGEYKGVGDRTVAAHRWVGNDQVVFTLASRENIYGDRYDVTRLVAYDVNTKQLTPLAWDGATGQASDILYVDHDKALILLERQSNRYGTERWQLPEVVRVDVKTGKFETVVRPIPGVTSGWSADANGVVRAGMGYDPDTGKNRLFYRSGASGNFEIVSREKDKDFSDSTVEPLLYLPEPDMALVRTNRDGFHKIYKANLKTMELGPVLFESKGYDVEAPVASFDRSRALGYSVVEKGPRVQWLDPDRRMVQQFLDESFGKGNSQIVSASRDDQRMIVYVGAPNQAGAFNLYDLNTGDFARLGWVSPVLKDMKLNPVSTIVYPASDGEKIPAVLTMPRHRTGKNLPLVILTHGGPFGPRDAESFDDWAQAVAELGYVVIQPNYRGSGGFGREWLRKGRNDGFGLRMQDDLNDAITYLSRQGIVDRNRVCMMGWSYGGYASARAAQRDPDKYRCTIAGAGVYDLQMMRSYDEEYLGSFGANYLSKGAADLDSVSPARNTKGKWAPILIVHGVRDQRVPIEQARTLVSRLKDAGKVRGVDFEFVEQPKNTHNLPYDEVRVEWLEAAEKWLAKYNPAYIDKDSDRPVPVGLSLAK
ncbi:MAG TPA: alpha/beta fold hydrolase [Allosphingosinicella sp.]|nr:alpha/beta fold hydrolase [Allosphingosinicella sp.]